MPPSPQELAREETKVAEAAQTEAKAKQVAEAVETVVRAAKEVESAKEEASGQAEKLAMAAQVGPRQLAGQGSGPPPPPRPQTESICLPAHLDAGAWPRQASL